ncbi:MAG TPA: arylsulfotransferase family protein, partial [Acidimicrobiia bacterium]|nr:arylsulfotransferase family protein [Acidimicrobiia bacterium]
PTATEAEPGEFNLTPAPASRSAAAVAAAADVHAFASRPDLQPPVMTVVKQTAGVSGYVGTTPRGGAQAGSMISDKLGNPYYFAPNVSFSGIFDVNVQTYKGQPVLTWWQGEAFGGWGNGEHPLFDQTYRQIATARAGNGYQADVHDMVITPDNDALVIIYNTIQRDLTSVGGSANGVLQEAVVQEVDIATGAVEFEWHSTDDVPLSKSNTPLPADPTKAWDYVHANSVALDADGNILVSARHTSSVYKLNRATGALMWTLGKNGDFTPTNFGDNEWFSGQHDARRRANGNLAMFDNASGNGPPVHPYSRGIELTLNETTKTATLAKELRTNPDVLGTSQGSFRPLGGGRHLVGWGAVGLWTEFDSSGNPVLDVRFPSGVQSYRATSIPAWHGRPTRPPDALVQRINSTTTRVQVSWNGATDVAKWVVLAGPDANHVSAVYARSRAGFETLLDARTRATTIVVEARDASDRPLGRVTKIFQGTASQSSSPVLGYWVARSDGSVGSFGNAPTLTAARVPRGDKVVGIAKRTAGGYWMATAKGDVLAIGAPRYGSTVHRHLTAPIVGISAAPDGRGYWLVGADGGVFAFGSARFFGSTGNMRLNQPIVGIAATTNGRGYWLVAADGGIFTFGSAPYVGGTGSMALVKPIVGMAVAPKGVGYWLVASDGGVFTFGSARFYGSTGNMHIGAPIAGITPTTDGLGYYLVAQNNALYSFGDANYLGTSQASGTARAVGLIPR